MIAKKLERVAGAGGGTSMVQGQGWRAGAASEIQSSALCLLSILTKPEPCTQDTLIIFPLLVLETWNDLEFLSLPLYPHLPIHEYGQLQVAPDSPPRLPPLWPWLPCLTGSCLAAPPASSNPLSTELPK